MYDQVGKGNKLKLPFSAKIWRHLFVKIDTTFDYSKIDNKLSHTNRRLS